MLLFVRLARWIGTRLGPDSPIAWSLLGGAARLETRTLNRRAR